MDAKPLEIPEGYTPGPWRVEGPDINRHEPCWRFISAPVRNWYHFANVVVARLIDGRAVDNPEGTANAALIALAPDMAAEITALRAERDRAMQACEALAARLAVPGEELAGRIELLEAQNADLLSQLEVPEDDKLDGLIGRLSPTDGCPFCGRAPYEYVDVGVGHVPVAVTCCELGIGLLQHGDEQLAAEVKLRREAADTLTALRARVAGLEGALTAAAYRIGVLHTYLDRPGHRELALMWVREARAALSPSAAQEARDAE